VLFETRSEVCSADEVTLVDAMHRANLNACAATGAQIVIDGCEVVLNGDCALRTGFLTLHTSDTSVRTVLTGKSTLVLVGALNDNTGGVVDKMNDTVGTLTNADATTDTLARINSGNTVLDRDGVLRANRYAVAVAKTSIGTELITAVSHVRGKAGLVTLVVALSGSNVARTVTGNVCNSLNNLFCLNTEDCGYSCRSIVTAGGAEVCFVGLLFSKSLSFSCVNDVVNCHNRTRSCA
jgi:hypothetical protein